MERPRPSPDGLAPIRADAPLSPRIANYKIDARYDPETHRVDASQTLRWTNTGTEEVDTLPFHLYLNAFKNSESIFMRESGGAMRGARASESGWGWIELERVRVGDDDLSDRLRYPGRDETVAWVALDAPVGPGATIEVHMEFSAQLPEVFARTGYKGEFAMVGQWFPKIGVRVTEAGRERWHCEPFHAESEFFADFGTYDVTLHVPSTHVVAATGVLVAATDEDDGSRSLHYRAEDVHDFAWMIDPHMEVLRGQAETELGPVEVRVYHRPRQRAFAERHLTAGIAAIEQYSELYLPYPWPIMSIVDPPLDAARGAGGMEYPTLVTTAGDSPMTSPAGVRLPEFVTIHEVGHNWFQGMLASDEIHEAWLDEGINEYTNGVVMRSIYGERGTMVSWLGMEIGYYELRGLSAGLESSPDPIDQPSFRFSSPARYGQMTYGKTAVALATLENVVGRERFAAAMRTYARQHAFRHPTGDDFQRTLEAVLGEDLDWFLDPALRRLGAADLRVEDIACERVVESAGVYGRGDERKIVQTDDSETSPWRCEVTVANVGTVPVPVDVEILFESGDRERLRWDDRSTGPRWHRFTVERSTRVEEVVIDPENEIVLDVGGFRGSLRRVPDDDAAERMAGRTRFWTQSAMQVLGL